VRTLERSFAGLSPADILKARGIRRLVYFHCDHFEPFRPVPGRAPDLGLALGDVERYLERSATRDFARAATLFYKANVNYLVDARRSLWRADPADLLGFVPPTAEGEALSARILGALSGDGRELQVHIHHENVTWNDRIRDDRVRAYLDPLENRRFDEARFELLVRLNLDLLAKQANFDPARWFFVHGHWALNASDPHECTLVREIEILRRNGCLGDFTQPAGRPHVDARLGEPYLARPVARAKGYDRPEAAPMAAAGALAVPDDRFLIWAAPIDHSVSSIDHYASFVRDRIAVPGRFARAQAAGAYAHDGVLYVKTHAHSMQPVYWQDEGGGPFPHDHNGIVGELTTLFEAADAAGASIDFLGVGAVFDQLLAAPAPPPRDLARVYRLAGGDPMAAVGCDVAFADAVGPAALPPLAPLPADALKPRRARKEVAMSTAIWPVVQPVAPARSPRMGVRERLVGMLRRLRR
jgi:hypothetical protein